MTHNHMEDVGAAMRADRKARASVKIKRPTWHYLGDINIEHGGMFYNLATFEDGHVECWRLQPCSDAGGPDNVYWIEKLSVIIHEPLDNVFAGVGDTLAQRSAHRELHHLPHAERVESALRCVGYDSPDMLADWDKRTTAERRHIVVYACVSYGHYDQDSSELISVGRRDSYVTREGSFTPATILRSNVNLRRYVRGRCE